MLEGLKMKLGVFPKEAAPKGAANSHANPEAPHAKGPFWALFENVFVGRHVRHADGRKGVVAFGPYQDASRSFEPVCSLRLEGQKNLLDVPVKELQQSWLQPSFVEDPQLVPEKVLELQRNNWGDLRIIQGLTTASQAATATVRAPTQQQEAPRNGAGPSVPGKSSGVAPAPTPPKPSTTANTTAVTASDNKGAAGGAGGGGELPANGGARQAKQRLVRGASDAQVITAAQTLQMLEAAEKAAPAAAAAGGKKRGRPPADADKGGAAKRASTQKRAPAASIGKKSAPLKKQQEEESEEESEESEESEEEEMVTPAEEVEEEEGSEEEEDEESEEEESEDVEAVTPRGRGGRAPAAGSGGWVKGWTGIKYPKEVTCKPGDKLQDELGDDELEGEYDVEAIVDEYTVGKKKWFLIKWRGYQLRLGTGPEGLRPGADSEAKGDWEPAKNITEALLKNWNEERPDWYASQIPRAGKRGKK